MNQSPAHTSAVFEAVRVPAMQARLALLVQGAAATPSRIDLYADPLPAAPGGAAVSAALVSIALSAAAGSVVDETIESVRSVRLVLDAPIEGQVTGADPTTGSVPTWGRIVTPAGGWWADVTVSVVGGTGEIQMAETTQEGDPPAPVARLFQGAFARITSFVIEG